MFRKLLVWTHRYVNLTIGAILFIEALTGSLLAFNSELERVFAPQLFPAHHPETPQLDLATIADRADNLVPGLRVVGVTLTEWDQVSVAFMPRPEASGRRTPSLNFDQFYVDPWTGAELGRRQRGDLSEGAINIMPFFYRIHANLSWGLSGERLLGIVALLWTIDCFIGFYLTFPVRIGAFWKRWKPAWLIKRRAGIYRLNVDFHRASGLWLWPLLFVFAWSSVMFDLRPAYEFVTRSVVAYESPAAFLRSLPRETGPAIGPYLSWHEAQSIGELLMQEQATTSAFTIVEPIGLGFLSAYRLWRYEVRSSRDLFERAPKGGGTTIYFSDTTGELKGLITPTGMNLGNTIESWLYALHMDRVFGLPFQIFTFILGLVLTMLGVTGVYIWWKKRKARQISARRSRRTTPSPRGLHDHQRV